MSDSETPVRGEIAELKTSLETIARRLDALSEDQLLRARDGATVHIARAPEPAWKRVSRSPLAVGILSSAATAVAVSVVLGLAWGGGAAEPPPAAPIVAIAPAPLPATPCTPALPQPVLVAQPPVVQIAPVSPPASGKMGSLTVVCLPTKCSEIIDNGTSLGPGHIFSRPTPAGRHHLIVRDPRGVTKALTIEVLPDQLKDVRIPMDGPGEAPSYL